MKNIIFLFFILSSCFPRYDEFIVDSLQRDRLWHSQFVIREIWNVTWSDEDSHAADWQISSNWLITMETEVKKKRVAMFNYRHLMKTVSLTFLIKSILMTYFWWMIHLFIEFSFQPVASIYIMTFFLWFQSLNRFQSVFNLVHADKALFCMLVLFIQKIATQMLFNYFKTLILDVHIASIEIRVSMFCIDNVALLCVHWFARHI